MVSLFVLSIGFVGVVQLATATLRNSFFQRDAVIASLLVQEGIELVYNVRDTSVAGGGGAFDGIPEATASYRVSPLGSTVSLESSNDYVLRNDANGFFVHGGSGMLTKFRRRVIVSSPSTDRRRIASAVTWSGADPPDTLAGLNSDCNKSNRCSFAQAELQEN
jgi:Tfp pilus assembly protein PilV